MTTVLSPKDEDAAGSPTMTHPPLHELSPQSRTGLERLSSSNSRLQVNTVICEGCLLLFVWGFGQGISVSPLEGLQIKQLRSVMWPLHAYVVGDCLPVITLDALRLG